LTKGDSTVKRRAANVLGEIGDASTFPALAKAARLQDPELRDQCVSSMVEIGARANYLRPSQLKALVGLGPLATTEFDEILDDSSDESSKFIAISVLRHTHDPAALPSLIRIVDSGGYLTSLTMSALEGYDDPRAVDAIIDNTDIYVSDTPRSAGVDALVEMGARAVPALIHAMQTGPKPDIRGHCACALEQIADPRSLEALQAATADPSSDVRFHAYEGLAAMPARSSWPVIERGVQDPDDIVRIEAVHAAGANGIAPAYDAVLAMTRSSSRPLREQAVDSLAGMDPQRALPDLLACLQVDNLKVAAIDALGAHRFEAAEPDLMKLLSSTDQDVADAAGAALADLGCTDAVPGLIKLLRRGSYHADDALVQIGSPAVPALVAALKDNDIQCDAIEILGRIGDRRAVVPITNLLNGRPTQFWAAEALGKLRDPRAIDPLLKQLVATTTASDRWCLAEALGDLKARAAVPALISLLPDPDCGWNAALALGEIGDRRALEPMLKAFHGWKFPSDGEGRWMFIDGLGHFKDERVFPILMSALDDGWPDSAAAARGLGLQRDRRALPALQDLLDSDDSSSFDDARDAIRLILGDR